MGQEKVMVWKAQLEVMVVSCNVSEFLILKKK
jgi:hypothetical protein